MLALATRDEPATAPASRSRPGEATAAVARAGSLCIVPSASWSGAMRPRMTCASVTVGRRPRPQQEGPESVPALSGPTQRRPPSSMRATRRRRRRCKYRPWGQAVDVGLDGHAGERRRKGRRLWRCAHVEVEDAGYARGLGGPEGVGDDAFVGGGLPAVEEADGDGGAVDDFDVAAADAGEANSGKNYRGGVAGLGWELKAFEAAVFVLDDELCEWPPASIPMRISGWVSPAEGCVRLGSGPGWL